MAVSPVLNIFEKLFLSVSLIIKGGTVLCFPSTILGTRGAVVLICGIHYPVFSNDSAVFILACIFVVFQ